MITRKRRRWIGLAFFVLVALGVVGLIVANGKRATRVKTYSPEVGPVEEVVTASSVGTVEARMTSTVSSEIQGKVLEIKVRPGQPGGSGVTKGSCVVVLDDRDIQAELAVLQNDIDTQILRKTQAEIRHTKVSAEWKRIKDTSESERDKDRAEKEAQIAAEDIKIAESTLKTLQARLAQVDLKQKKSKIAAPYDGVVYRLHTEVGESVSPGSPLFAVLSAGPLLVRAPIDEVDRGLVRLKAPARVTFDGFRDAEGKAVRFEGTVEEIMAAASTDKKSNRTIDVKISVPKMPPEIVVGMSAHVEIVVKRKPEGLRISTHLIHEDRDGATRFVYVVEDGKARKRKVRVGLANWKTSEILEGLSARDRVVNPLSLSEDRAIEDGTPLEIVP